MYRRSKFLEVLIEIRQEMAREADYDLDLFAVMVRSGRKGGRTRLHDLNGAQGPAGKRKTKPAAGKNR